jgi:hypothetical protein
MPLPPDWLVGGSKKDHLCISKAWLGVIVVSMLAARAAASPTVWLERRTREIVAACQLPGPGNTTLFTPDATHSYGAQWTRDFAYAVMFAPDTLPSGSIVRAAVRATFGGQRAADGCMPDRVQADGTAVYSPGSTASPFADHAIDNGPFAALLLAAATAGFPADGDADTADAAAFFCELQPAARRGLDFVNRSAVTGLVYNSEAAPNCTYGFTDTVAKTGQLLFSSLLFLDASLRMASAAAKYGCGDADGYRRQASQIEGSFLQGDALYDGGGSGLWLAASRDNALPDVWGSLYLLGLDANVTTASRRHKALQALQQLGGRVVQAGQLRHLPSPLNWMRCFGACPAPGVYQNGGWWSTPLPYLARAALRGGEPGSIRFARAVVSACMADFEAGGIYEYVDYGHPARAMGVLNYTASATNVLWAARKLGLS